MSPRNAMSHACDPQTQFHSHRSRRYSVPWHGQPAALRGSVLPLHGPQTLSFIRVIVTHKLRVSSERPVGFFSCYFCCVYLASRARSRVTLAQLLTFPVATLQTRAFCNLYVPVCKHVRVSIGRHMKVSTPSCIRGSSTRWLIAA